MRKRGKHTAASRSNNEMYQVHEVWQWENRWRMETCSLAQATSEQVPQISGNNIFIDVSGGTESNKTSQQQQ